MAIGCGQPLTMPPPWSTCVPPHLDRYRAAGGCLTGPFVCIMFVMTSHASCITAPPPNGPLHRDAVPPARGRAAGLNTPNRHETVRLEVLGDWYDRIAEQQPDGRQVVTEVHRDHSRTVINRVDSPDVGFDWSVNPYRGCEHGCIYCYARPDHERLGFSAGLDFETKIIAKVDAPALLEKELARPAWRGEPIAMAGVTDVYQPVERKLEITRGCLGVMAACGQPVSITTKSGLITRDLDLLSRLAARDAVRVAISITTLDPTLAAALEPRAAAPNRRLETIRELAEAGIPVSVMVAPVIPGLTEWEMAPILEAAADAGARGSGYIMLRLPEPVKALFADWLHRHRPQAAAGILGRIRQVRGGQLNDATFGRRMRGQGHRAAQVQGMFEVLRRRHGLDRGIGRPSSRAFAPPRTTGNKAKPEGQLPLFGPG